MRWDKAGFHPLSDDSPADLQIELFPIRADSRIVERSTASATQSESAGPSPDIGGNGRRRGEESDQAGVGSPILPGARRSIASPRRRATDGLGAGPVPAAKPAGHRPLKDRAALFELHCHPFLIVDRQGLILDANSAARSDISDGRIGVSSDGLLRLGGRECTRRFLAALAAPATDEPKWRRLVVRMSDGEWRLARLRRLPDGDDVALVEIQPSIADLDPDVSALAQAFALTAAEADILSSLLEAQAPKEIARQLGISSHTVRAHMRAIYAKLGVRARSGMMKRALGLVC